MPAIRRLFIDGERWRERFIVLVTYMGSVNPERVPLRGVEFRYLVKLAMARICTRGGWISMWELDDGPNQHRYIYLLRKALPVKIETRYGTGRYRLRLPARHIGFNDTTLREFEDHRVQEMFV